MLRRCFLAAIAPRRTAHAHCDIPCGIYDPAPAQIAARTVSRMVELIEQNSGDDVAQRNKFARCVQVKEVHAENVKREVQIIWSDYFKPEHLEKFPDLHETCWKAAKQASQVKRTVDIAEAQKLLDLIDRIDEMWRATGGPQTTRMQQLEPVGADR